MRVLVCLLLGWGLIAGPVHGQSPDFPTTIQPQIHSKVHTAFFRSALGFFGFGVGCMLLMKTGNPQMTEICQSLLVALSAPLSLVVLGSPVISKTNLDQSTNLAREKIKEIVKHVGELDPQLGREVDEMLDSTNLPETPHRFDRGPEFWERQKAHPLGRAWIARFVKLVSDLGNRLSRLDGLRLSRSLGQHLQAVHTACATVVATHSLHLISSEDDGLGFGWGESTTQDTSWMTE